MTNAFRSLLFSISGRFGLEPREDTFEYDFEWEGRTVRILPNPKDEDLILVETELGGPTVRKLFEDQAVLVALHRLNGEAVAIRDWRFALDETEAPILRANFRAVDFEGVGAFDAIVADAARFADIVISMAEIAAGEGKRVSSVASEEVTFLRG